MVLRTRVANIQTRTPLLSLFLLIISSSLGPTPLQLLLTLNRGLEQPSNQRQLLLTLCLGARPPLSTLNRGARSPEQKPSVEGLNPKP